MTTVNPTNPDRAPRTAEQAARPEVLVAQRTAAVLSDPWFWGKLAILATLFAAVYYPNLVRLWLKTNPISGNPNWSHSVVVPIVGLYYLYLRREQIVATPVRPRVGLDFDKPRLLGALCVALVGGVVWLLGETALTSVQFGLFNAGNIAALGGKVLLGLAALALVVDWGLALLLGGLALGAAGIYPIKNDFIWDVGMIVTLAGVVLTLCGFAMMRHALFPVLFLFCALPWPELVYSKVALPLQHNAAWMAVKTLNVGGVAAEKIGTKIIIPQPDSPMPRELNVAEACAGMRSLMTFITLGAAVAFLSERPLWQKLVITASAVPIAILCNMSRVSGQGLLDYYVSQKFAQDFAHTFVGLVMLIPAFFLILGVAWLVDNLLVDDVEADDPPTPTSTSTPTARPEAA